MSIDFEPLHVALSVARVLVISGIDGATGAVTESSELVAATATDRTRCGPAPAGPRSRQPTVANR